MIPSLEMGSKSGNVVNFYNNYVTKEPDHEAKFILLKQTLKGQL